MTAHNADIDALRRLIFRRATCRAVPEELGTYGAVDAGGFVGSFLLSTQAHGVATTPQAALAMQSSFIRNYFAIPEGRKVVCGISFGYADRAHPVNGYRTERAPGRRYPAPGLRRAPSRQPPGTRGWWIAVGESPRRGTQVGASPPADYA